MKKNDLLLCRHNFIFPLTEQCVRFFFSVVVQAVVFTGTILRNKQLFNNFFSLFHFLGRLDEQAFPAMFFIFYSIQSAL